MKLTYIPRQGVACPGDGWPAADHDEPDTELAHRKIASGFYRGENDKERRESERAARVAKTAVNKKAEAQIASKIATADDAATLAKREAAETRKRLGREE